jgi:hypothetical protein
VATDERRRHRSGVLLWRGETFSATDEAFATQVIAVLPPGFTTKNVELVMMVVRKAAKLYVPGTDLPADIRRTREW